MGDLIYNAILNYVIINFIANYCVIVVIIIQMTPLHVSSLKRHSQVVEMLQSQPGIVVDSCDEV